MKPPAFAYHRPATVPEALAVLAEVGHDGKVLAGGQSLVPLLNMRLAAPAHLVDVNWLAELDEVSRDDGAVRVGALARHARVEHDPGAREVLPLLGQAIGDIAHTTVRNRGTVVGSLVHADPAAELPAVLVLLGGSVELASAGNGSRRVAAADFFVGPLESALRPGELATAAVFPRPPAGSGSHPTRKHSGDRTRQGATSGGGGAGEPEGVEDRQRGRFDGRQDHRPTPGQAHQGIRGRRLQRRRLGRRER